MEVVEFKVRLHCKSCEKAVRKSLLNINDFRCIKCIKTKVFRMIVGVKCVEIDMISCKITVLGYVNRRAVAKAILKTGRRAEAWPPAPKPTPPPREDYFSPRLPKGFRCIVPQCGGRKFQN